MSLRFEFDGAATLPRLSWCAHVRRGGTTTVRCGEDVERRADRFVEGAWAGDFGPFAFEESHYLAGSGGVAREDHVVFLTPFHPLERLYVLRGPEGIRVSNSLAFLLADAGEQLDLAHPNYVFDLLKIIRRGLTWQPGQIPLRSGVVVETYTACRVIVDRDLILSRAPSPIGPPPANYTEYYALLAGVSQRIVKNAADPARTRTYRPVTACSRGYDSTAAAALAKSTGCSVGVTYAHSGQPLGQPPRGAPGLPADDSGAECLHAMGMEAFEYDRKDVLEIPGHPKAEFYQSLLAVTDAGLRAMEDKLSGSVFFSGRHGERVWGPTSRCKQGRYEEPDDVNLSGHAIPEFRLRSGFIHLPAPYIGSLHAKAIYRITHSDEMRPWKLGTGYYDRPIARRLAEEAGVPREAFGQTKFGGAEDAGHLGDESEADLRDFIASEVPRAVRTRLIDEPIDVRDQRHDKVHYLRTNYSHLPLGDFVLNMLQTDRLHRLWKSPYLYAFHWGFDKMRRRYVN